MKIVDVCAFYTPHGGGVRTYIEQKLRIGPELGHDIVIIAPGDRAEVIERGPRARIITLPSPRFPLDRKYWYFADEAALHAAIDAEAPDMVEASSPWRSAAMVARWPGAAPRALIMHADPLSAYAYRWFEPLLARETIDRRFEIYWQHLRELGQTMDRVVVANAQLEARLVEGGVAKVALHPMGVEADTFSPDARDPALRAHMLDLLELPESATLLVGVGRLSPEKRWPMVVDAAVAAGAALPVGLAIFGAGRHRSRIERAIGGNPHVRLMAPEKDRARFAAILASADALVHGCEAETFCMAAAEARASGTPVIVPDEGGAADHAAGGAGITYKAASAIALADAIERFIAQPLRPPRTPVTTMRDHFARLFDDYRALVDARRIPA